MVKIKLISRFKIEQKNQPMSSPINEQVINDLFVIENMMEDMLSQEQKQQIEKLYRLVELHTRCPQLNRLIRHMSEGNFDKAIAIIGNMQSGKSECAVLVCYIKCTIAKIKNDPYFAVIGIKQVDHSHGFIKAIKNLNEQIQKCDSTLPSIKLFDFSNLTFTKSGELGNDNTTNNVVEILQDKTVIPMCISYVGHKRINKLNQLLNNLVNIPNTTQKCFVLFDESHATKNHNVRTSIFKELAILTRNPSVFQGVCSATAIYTLADGKTPIEYVVPVPEASGYVGVTNMNHISYPYFQLRGENITDNPGLLGVIAQALSMPAIKDKDEYLLPKNIPQLVCVNITTIIEYHKQIAAQFRYSSQEFNTITVNSEETSVTVNPALFEYIRTEKQGKITIKSNRIIDDEIVRISNVLKIDAQGRLNLSKYSIEDILDMFYQFPAETVQRIVVVGGEILGESVAVASSGREICIDLMILNQSQTDSIERDVQKIRNSGYLKSFINGSFLPDRRQTTIMCPADFFDSAIRYVTIQKNIVQCLVDDTTESLITEMEERNTTQMLIGEYEINRARLPASMRKSGLSIGKPAKGADRFSTVDKLTSTKDIEDRFKNMKKVRTTETNRYAPAPDTPTVVPPVVEPPVVEPSKSEIPEKEFKRLTESMFPKWSKETSKIAKFMQGLDPEKKYEEEEMKEYSAKKDIPIHHVLDVVKHDRKGKGYGKIMKKDDNNTYYMYPELVASYIAVMR